MNAVHDWLAQIHANLPMSQIVGASLKLDPMDSGWKACCPFHDEKTPSFTVDDRAGIFQCFGCSESGNALQWLMKREDLSFPSAVAHLAAMAGGQPPRWELASEAVDDPCVPAWADYRLGIVDEELEQPRRISVERSWEASKLLIQEQAGSLQGVIAKLRLALWTNTGDFRVEAAALAGDPLSNFQSVFDEALAGDEAVNEGIWSAITSLERLAGVA